MSTRRFASLFHARGILLSAAIVVTIAVLLLTACPNPTTVRYEPYVSPGAVSPLPDDQYYAKTGSQDYQWDLRQIDMPEAWGIIRSSAMVGKFSPVVVAVIDTGILPGHPDLGSNIIYSATDPAQGYDFISEDSPGSNTYNRANDDDGRDPDPLDPGDGNTAPTWHGSHVAGTIAALTNNGGEGIAGIGWDRIRILPVRALGVTVDDTSALESDLIQAVFYAAGLPNSSGAVPSADVKVINMSFGSPGALSSVMYDAIQACVDKGITVVVAAGNDSSSVRYPAAFDNTIAVGSTNYAKLRASYSNYGQQLSLVAPGGDIDLDENGDGEPDGVLSTIKVDGVLYQTNVGIQIEISDGYAFYDGTSMATPHVAGVAALLYSYAPNLNQSQVFTILMNTAEDLGVPGWDKYYGHGLINAKRALEYLISAADMPPLTALGTGSVGASSTSGTAVSVAATALPGVKPVQRSGAILPQGGPAEYAPDSIIVKLKAGAESRNVTVEGRLGQTSGVASVGRSAGRFRTVRLTPGKSVTEVIRRVASDPDVEYAQPNYVYHLIQ